jgi:acyl-CoA reductase-like NAD-dependent aldehyde dehydrogenase
MLEDTDVSALISTGERDRVTAWIEEAVGSGARVATGGTVDGTVLQPTVLTDVTADMKVSSQEVFGPVVSVQRYRRLRDAFDLANDTRYGLQAAIYTRDLGVALEAARTLDFGGVLVNEVPTYRTDQMPYGGVRDSGNTKEGPHYAVREMTEERLIVLQG